MLERIVERLRKEDSPLVRLIRQRDQQLGWQLMDQLTQLRVQTIDGFCYYLAKQSLAGQNFNRVVQGVEADFYYQIAVQNWLLDYAQTASAQLLLKLVAFQHQILISFLSHMLARRDRWLTRLLSLDQASLRSQMDAELKCINQDLLNNCHFPCTLFKAWQQLYQETICFYRIEQLTDNQWQLLSPTHRRRSPFRPQTYGAVLQKQHPRE